MKKLTIETATDEKVLCSDFKKIEEIISGLRGSDNEFLVLANLDNGFDYIQVAYNFDIEDEPKYLVEVRLPLADDDFRHYQYKTNQLDRVLKDFADFFNNKNLNLDEYVDITESFSDDFDYSLIEKALKEFLDKSKFSNQAWQVRGLRDSGKKFSTEHEALFNELAHDLLESHHEDFKEHIVAYLKSLNVMDYDTEERDFVLSYFDELSVITSVDLSSDIEEWLKIDQIIN